MRQALFGLRRGKDAVRAEVEFLRNRLRRSEGWISELLGGEVKDRKVLIVGHGPRLIEARYFGVHNRVTGIDLDVVPRGFDLAGYWGMLRQNGFGRLVKTMGRKALGLDRAYERAWKQVLGVERFAEPELLVGDICEGPPAAGAFDVVVSDSVFQHIPDPERALASILASLRPGGVFLIKLHLYTSHTGHHDIRAFTGQPDALPPWAHLRAATRHLVQPSAYLNEWRLSRWRELFGKLAPGFGEHLEMFDEEASRRRLSDDVRTELADYSDEELLTFDAFFMGKTPDDS